MRLVRAYAAGTGNVSVATGVRTNLLATSIQWTQGRAYRISFGCRILMSASTNVMSFVVVRAAIGDLWHPGSYGPSGASDPIAVYNSAVVARSSATTSEVITLAAQVFDTGIGTVQGLSSVPYWLMVEEIGPAADFPNAITF